MANLWRARIPIDEMLLRFDIAGPSICDCCFNEVERLDHLFADGPRAHLVWSSFEQSLGMNIRPMGFRPRCLAWWNQPTNNMFSRFLFKIMPSLICWFLWRFYSSRVSIHAIISNISWHICSIPLISLCTYIPILSSSVNSARFVYSARSPQPSFHKEHIMDSLPILIVVSGIQSKRRHHSSSLRYPVKGKGAPIFISIRPWNQPIRLH